jgi:hypothetical protein
MRKFERRAVEQKDMRVDWFLMKLLKEILIAFLMAFWHCRLIIPSNLDVLNMRREQCGCDMERGKNVWQFIT